MTLFVRTPALGAMATLNGVVAASLRRPVDWTAALLVLAGLPVAVAAWLVLSPAQVFSNALTWDLMFNLAGAWHVQFGDRPHIDFHDPLGALNFHLTALGFRLVGAAPHAFLVGMTIVAAALFALAFHVALRRLPLVPAVLFVGLVCLLALMPANVGERPDHYTLAMSYNRYGWAAYAVLGLALFVPPRRDAPGGEAAEIAGCAVLVLGLYELKITYFAVALGTIVVAMALQPHVRRCAGRWSLAVAALGLWAVAPTNWPYLADIWGAAGTGAIRSSLVLHARNFVAAGADYAPYLAFVVIGTGLWLSGRAPVRLPLTLAFLFVACLGLLTQNTQSAGMPALIVSVLVLYDHLRSRFHAAPDRELVPLLAALLVLPILALANAAFSIAVYHVNATRPATLFVAPYAGLRGLAVPAGQPGAFASFPRNGNDLPLPNGQGVPVPRYDLSQQEYVATLLSAAEMLEARPPGGIALFDQVNPLPFMLGWRPAPGANLWSLWDLPLRPAESYLGPVRYVLVPRFPTERNWTARLVTTYADYLATHFERGEEGADWTLFVRREDAGPGVVGPDAYSAGGTNM